MPSPTLQSTLGIPSLPIPVAGAALGGVPVSAPRGGSSAFLGAAGIWGGVRALLIATATLPDPDAGLPSIASPGSQPSHPASSPFLFLRRFPVRVPGAHFHQQQLLLQPQGAAGGAGGGAARLDAPALVAPTPRGWQWPGHGSRSPRVARRVPSEGRCCRRGSCSLLKSPPWVPGSPGGWIPTSIPSLQLRLSRWGRRFLHF